MTNLKIDLVDQGLVLHPGDTIVLKTSIHLTQQEADQVQAAVEAKGIHALVIGPRWDVVNDPSAAGSVA